MKTKSVVLISSVFFMLLFLTKCKHEDDVLPNGGLPDTTDTNVKIDWPTPPTNDRVTDVVYFENDILKLMVNKCASEGVSYTDDGIVKSGCHSSIDRMDGIVLDNYNDIIELVSKDSLANDSKLYTQLFDTGKPMPQSPAAALSTEEIQMVKTWIEQGFQENSCNPCKDSIEGSFVEVREILYKNCAGCHSFINNSFNAKQLSFFTPDNFSESNIIYQNVVDYSPILLATMKHPQTNQIMPKYIGRLYKCEVDILEKWIENGKPN